MEITKTTKKVQVVTVVDEPRFTLSDLTQDEINILRMLYGKTNAQTRAALTGRAFDGDWKNGVDLWNKLNANATCEQDFTYELRAR